MAAATETCRLCGGAAVPAFAVGDLNQGADDGRFRYGRCTICRAYQLENVPEDLGAYYPTGYYADIDGGMEKDGAALAQGQLGLFADRVARGRLIEVGPGAGGLMRQAGRAGFTERVALERDAGCCARLAADGVEVHQTEDAASALAGLEPADAVALFHVIEHVPNPLELLAAAAAAVRPGGLLIVATPNPDSLSFRVSGRRWLHLDAPRHLFLLPLALLTEHARRAGLTPAGVASQDLMGRTCDDLAWGPWSRAVAPGPAGPLLEGAVRRLARPLERRGGRASTYTALFARPR